MMETQLNYAELFAFIASKTKGKKLEILNNYLGLNSMQTLLIIPVFNANCDSDTANIGDIADYYDLSKLDILAHFSDLQFLKDKNYIIDSEPSMIIKDIKDIEFKLNENLYDAILHNRDIPNLESIINNIIPLILLILLMILWTILRIVEMQLKLYRLYKILNSHILILKLLTL